MAIVYAYRPNGPELLRCESCGSVAPLAEFDLSTDILIGVPKEERRRERWLCQLCAGSVISSAVKEDPNMEKPITGTYKAIAQVGNIMLDLLLGRTGGKRNKL